MISGLILVVCYVVVGCAAAFLAVWLGATGSSFLYEAGKLAGLSGFTLLVLQAVLAARWKWVSRPYGLDIVYRFHRWMGLFAGLLLLVHPVMLAAGGAGWGLIFSLEVPWHIWFGKAVLVVLSVSLVVCFFRKNIAVRFERWRLVHGVAGVFLLAGGFAHSWFAGSDFAEPVLAGLWIALLAGGVVVFGHHRFVRPAVLRRRPYKVKRVKGEAEGVWTVELERPEGQEVLDYMPGQFHFITLHRGPGLPEEEHHFTISSSPAQEGLVGSTIKAVGDFTSTIGQTSEGDTATVQGPFGRFSYKVHPEERDIVFIAGGIGITPVMSMLRCMRDRREDYRVLLLYANKTESSIVFREEIEQIEAREYPQLEVVHVLSRASEEWDGEKGHIDREILERYVGGDVGGKSFYICGPEAMRESVVSQLKHMGVKDRRIRTEIFSLAD